MVMKGVILFLLLVFSLSDLKAQAHPQKKTLYTVNIQLKADNQLIRGGAFYEVKDSSILVSPGKLNEKYLMDNPVLKEFHFTDIETIRTGKKNRVLKGLGYGAITGIAAGVIIGLIEGNDNEDKMFSSTAGEKAYMAGVMFGLAGGAIGTFAGLSATVKIPVNGNFETFKNNKTKISCHEKIDLDLYRSINIYGMRWSAV